jgi:DNA-directed RNA polymerase subunit RPC12/RpoP
MSTKGKRKFRCAECKEEHFFHWVERNRGSRPRCPGCGSIAIDPVSDEGYSDIVMGNRKFLEETQGSVVRRSDTNPRKVIR